MAGTGLTASAAPAGDGVILRWSEAVYRHMALGLWLVGLCAPTLIAAMSLAPVSANAPLLVAACLPVAPALASGLYAVRRWRAEGGAAPFALLLAGLRGTAMDVLRWWAPVLAVAALLTVNLIRPPGGPIDLAVRAVSMLLLVLLVLVSGHATVISSGFDFRTRDTVRIALYLLGADRQRTLAFVSLLIVAAGVTYLASEAVLLLLAWAFVSLAELLTRPTVTTLTTRFTTRAE